jgi:hypothetical protein
MGVAMGVHTNDGIDEFCQHGQWSAPLSWARVNVGASLDGITERHICDGSHPQADRLLIGPSWWARSVPATAADRSNRRHAKAARS